ncbi:hypothetical protein Psch_01997 [Pelotomaculum schinkii]|uniref:CAAX amino terminal protease self-immunity n=1 Tax=Pelotomaculum schinkii TaxID=78350 RepID=A0A4Y7RHG9_9FIRM|nr:MULTISPECIES: hypothetical protein [Pelotomaculum]TEB08434.1 hypothetical protein Psch_01997 [Pelotomaculum schinkii]TEB17194.1 hypothetical protein Psfp_00698 [Pelotomaculum sp. FP]
MAAALAWEVNKHFGRWAGKRWEYLAPLVEEISKTAAAVLFGGDILLTHLSFGAVEGFWEYFNRRNGYYAGLAALASHSIFGFITLSVYRFYGTLPPALGAAFLTHMAWNCLVVKLSAKRHNK